MATEAPVFKVPEAVLMPPPPPPQQPVPSGEFEHKPSEAKLDYEPPSWSARLKRQHFVEVLKDGVIIETISLPMNKEFLTIGRLPTCDISQEHPSISRHHAILQFKDDGKIFLYDLGSTHGTKLNKERIVAKRHVRVPMGSFIKFGESSRNFVLQGPPDEDEEAEEKIRQRVTAQLALKASLRRQKEEREAAERASAEDEGISWGMKEDAKEEDDDDNVPEESNANPDDGDAWYMRDPKNTLRGWFEFHGQHMAIEIEEDGPGHARIYNAKLKLPIEGAFGSTIYATASATKKRDAEREVAIDACRKLDAKNMLRTNDAKANAAVIEARKRKMKEMYGDPDDNSDDDEFFDRTAVKKQQHKKSGTIAATYDTLMAKRAKLLEEREELRKKHDNALLRAQGPQQPADEEDLDSYMEAVSNNLTQQDARKIQLQIDDLDKEVVRLDKVIKIAQPTSLPTSLALLHDPEQHRQPVIPHSHAVSHISNKPSAKPDEEEKEDNEDDKKAPNNEEKDKVIVSEPTVEQQKEIPVQKEKPNPKKRQYGAMRSETYYEEQNKDLSDWVPPMNQTGDGKTALNTKFGY